MKITPKQYAQSLARAITPENIEEVASNFVELAYKKKQQKDIKKVIDLLDEEYALTKGLILAKAYSEKELTEKELSELKLRCEQRIGKKVLLKNFINKEKVAGITVEIDGLIYDFSLSGRIDNFKRQLIS